MGQGGPARGGAHDHDLPAGDPAGRAPGPCRTASSGCSPAAPLVGFGPAVSPPAVPGPHGLPTVGAATYGGQGSPPPPRPGLRKGLVTGAVAGVVLVTVLAVLGI
ncbi:hypothetical protein [Streptomyces sp. NPDC057854]|uniref:hypothetical protein n=1 Tax=unclassified Streptomyces TaxID=2593676 RepID=UPI0036887932